MAICQRIKTLCDIESEFFITTPPQTSEKNKHGSRKIPTRARLVKIRTSWDGTDLRLRYGPKTHDFLNAKIGLFSLTIIYSNFSLLASDDEDFELDPLDEDDDIISDSENSNASR